MFKDLKSHEIAAKKLLTIILSLALLLSQGYFTQIAYAASGENSSSQYNPNHALNNIQDNPIRHIEVDNSIGLGKTSLERAQNGTPIVHINNASAGGVSVNYYKDFNVNKENLILNNYRGETVNTNLGGAIYGNPNFNNTSGREADIILNEVTSVRQSRIEGYIEIAGRKADLIVANPNGIMVGGAGFINVGKISLITGTSGMGNRNDTLDAKGRLNPFLLTDDPNAKITVVGRNVTDKEGKVIAYNLGIDALENDYIGLISKIIEINGDIIGSQNTKIMIAAGNDKAVFNSETNEFEGVTSKESAQKPEFAIDSTAFGGIYAGQITIIATQDGVGTRIRADLISSVEDIKFDTNGNIIIDAAHIETQNADKQITINNKSETGTNNIEIISGVILSKTIEFKTDNIDIKNNTSILASNNILMDNENEIKINASNILSQSVQFNTSDMSVKNGSNISGTSDMQIEAKSDNLAGKLEIDNSSILSQEIDIKTDDMSIKNGSSIVGDNSLQIEAKSNNKKTQLEIESSNIVSQDIRIKTDDISISNLSNIYAEKTFEIDAKSGISGQINKLDISKSDIFSNNVLISIDRVSIKDQSAIIGEQEVKLEITKDLNNEQGAIRATNDNGIIEINAGAGINNVNGVIESKGDIKLNVFTNNFNAYGTIKAIDGSLEVNANKINIYNTSDGTNLLGAYNINLNAKSDVTNAQNSNLSATNNLSINGASIYNDGNIIAGNDVSIIGTNFIRNGNTIGSDSIIQGANSVYMKADTRIINYGYIQAIGKKDANGQRTAGTLSLISLADINADYKLNDTDTTGNETDTVKPFTDAIQAKIDQLHNITDLNELDELLREALDANNEDVFYDIQKRIRLLQINDIIEIAKEGYEFNADVFTLGYQFNLEEYDDEGNLIQGSTEVIIIDEEKVQENLKELLGDSYIAQDWLLGDEENAESDRLVRIEEAINDKKMQIQQQYESINWQELTEPEIQEKVEQLYAQIEDAKYRQQDWILMEFDSASNKLSSYDKYLGALRIDNKKQNTVEKTGIHNYGRLYSNGDMTLTSKSVVHNNNGALIYSNKDMSFNVNDVLFNNSQSLGEGIRAIGGININGYNGSTSRLSQLINYNGRIEADGDIKIKAHETINYGSDNVNYFKNPKSASVGRMEDYGDASGAQPYKISSSIVYDSKLTSNKSEIISNNGNINIDSIDNVINYNSLIYGDKSVKIEAGEIHNTIAEFKVTQTNYWRERYELSFKERAKIGFKSGHGTRSAGISYTDVILKSKNAKAQIVSRGNVEIKTNMMDNGVDSGKTKSGEINKNANEHPANGGLFGGLFETNPISQTTDPNAKPYARPEIDKTLSDAIVDISLIFDLSGGKYGMYRPPSDINSKYLYETDPLLTNEQTFLGSQYFMNRIGLDPFSIEQKFLGDSFMEREMIKRSIEQITLFENKHITDEEIDVYIDNLYNTLTPEKVNQYGLEFGKELTVEQIGKLESDIVWYVEKEIKLPSGEKVKALVPQVYLSKESIAKLTATEEGLTNIQIEFSKKQATDIATVQAENAAQLAVQKEKERLIAQAKADAKAKAESKTQQAKVEEKVKAIIESDPKKYKELVEEKIANLTVFTAVYTQKGFNIEEYAQEQVKQDLKNQETAKLQEQYYAQNKQANLEKFKMEEEAFYQAAFDNTFAKSFDIEFEKSAAQNVGKTNTDVLIAGNNVTIQSLSNEHSILNNAGAIQGNRTVVIAMEEINNDTKAQGGKQAAISAGDLLYLNADTINNNSAIIAATNKESLVVIEARELNNTTDSQKEEIKMSGFEKTETSIGLTAMIGGAGSVSINTSEDVNLKGSAIIAKDEIDLSVGGNLNSKVVQDYSRTYVKVEEDGGIFGTDTTKEEETIKVRNISSYITSTNGGINANATNMNLQSTHIDSQEGTNLIASENINLTTALDYDLHSLKETEDNTWTGGSIDKNVNEKGTNKGNEINSKGTINVVAGKDLNSISTQFNTQEEGNINLYAGYRVDEEGRIKESETEGKVNLLAAQDFENNYSYHEEYGGALDMITNVDIDLSKNGLSLSTSYEKTVDESNINTQIAVVNELASSAGLNIKATGDIISVGSQIQAEGDINVDSDKNILLLSANNSQTTESKHEDTTVTVGVKIGNAYVDVVLAADALVKAGEAVKKASDEVERMEDLKSKGKASQAAVDDAKANKAMAELNLANATLGLAASAAGAATAASSSFGTGLYAAGFANYETNGQSQNTQSTWQTQGNIISNGNISFNAGNNMMQEGTNIYANNGTLSYDIENDLTIKASKDTYQEENKEGHYSGGVSVGNNAVQLSASASESASRTIASTYNNSEVQANNIVINVGNDATLSGANVNATNELEANIGNNLTVESLQDTYYSKGNSWGVDLSVGIGTKGMGNFLGGKESNVGNNTAGLGFNVGSENTDMAWVGEQTSLTGGSVNITVGNKTTVTGAVIAADSGDLTLNTASLSYSDINDYNYNKSSNYGVNMSFSSNPKAPKGKSNISQKAKTLKQATVKLKKQGKEKEQETKATIGEGTIKIDGKEATQEQTEGLNRDINETQTITKDEITNALNGEVGIDMRFVYSVIDHFTDKKNEISIVEDIKKIAESLGIKDDKGKEKVKDFVEAVNGGNDEEIRQAEEAILENVPEELKGEAKEQLDKFIEVRKQEIKEGIEKAQKAGDPYCNLVLQEEAAKFNILFPKDENGQIMIASKIYQYALENPDKIQEIERDKNGTFDNTGIKNELEKGNFVFFSWPGNANELGHVVCATGDVDAEGRLLVYGYDSIRKQVLTESITKMYGPNKMAAIKVFVIDANQKKQGEKEDK